jgi:hypothetical protein
MVTIVPRARDGRQPARKSRTATHDRPPGVQRSVGAQDAIGPPRRRRQIGEIDVQRRKLFELYYADQITPESFHAEDLRLNEQLAALQQEREPEPTDNGIEQFDRVVSPLLNWTGTSSGRRHRHRAPHPAR